MQMSTTGMVKLTLVPGDTNKKSQVASQTGSDSVGGLDGSFDGCSEGALDGSDDGLLEGTNEGIDDGLPDGILETLGLLEGS